MSNLPDGSYQLRVKTDCLFDGTLTDEFNWGSTPILTGVIDTSEPEVLGFVSPSSLLGADPIAIRFTESIRCDQVTYEMTVPAYTGTPTVDLEAKCSGSSLQIAPVSSLWTDYPTYDVELTVQNVFDDAGNEIVSTPLTYTFTVTQDWTCSVPTHCDDVAGEVYCDFNDANTVCTDCDSGWSGSDCTTSSRAAGVESVEESVSPLDKKRRHLERLREALKKETEVATELFSKLVN